MTVDQKLPSIIQLMQINKVPSILNTKSHEEEKKKKDEEIEEEEQPNNNTSTFLNKVLNFSPVDDTKPLVPSISSSKPKQVDKTRHYYCFYCHKEFTRPSTLKTHMYMHTGEKPFHCSYPNCKSKFSVLSNMKRHLRITHNNNKQSFN